jgi:hypothetical protein
LRPRRQYRKIGGRAHPTVKPVALVADAIKDCSRRGEIVLDPFWRIRQHADRGAPRPQPRRVRKIACEALQTWYGASAILRTLPVSHVKLKTIDR